MSHVSFRSSSRAFSLVAALAATALAAPGIHAQQAGAVTGEQKTLVIVADFTDRAVSCSTGSIHRIMFDQTASVDALYRENSGGTLWFSGEVVGPFTIDRTSTEPCSLSALSTAAEAKATAAGVNVAAYPRRVYVLPANSCGSGGYGTLGGLSTSTWIFNCSVPGNFLHNVGHNLGLNHAGTAGLLGENEYNDNSDPMGVAGLQFYGLNAPHRQQLGWLKSNQIQRVTEDGYFNIAPLGLDPELAAGPQVLTIAKPDTNEYYYLSYRLPVGFDQYIDGTAFHRLSIHRYRGDGSMTRTHLLALLDDSQSFNDSVNGITVTLISHASAYATARVQFTGAACSPVAPSVSISPQAQSAVPGTSLDYAVTVTNNDSVGCPAGTFTLNQEVPSGWAGQLSTTNVTLNPDAAGEAVLRVISPVTSAPGTYRASVNVIEVGAPGRTASGALSYTVADSMPPSAPSKLTATVNKRQKRVELSWGLSTDNVAVSGYGVWRNGLRIAVTAGTTWVDSDWKVGAPYNYSVATYDLAGNLSSASNTVSVTLK